MFDIEEVFPTINEGDFVKVVYIANDQYKSYFEHAIGNTYEIKYGFSV